MFETIVNRPAGAPRRRWTTTVLSAITHVTVLVVIAVSSMYAADVLPEPAEMMTFVVAAPAPPPPPPPIAAAAPKPVKTVTKRVAPRPEPVAPRPVVAAPVEAPATITPETGLEGAEFEAPAIEPGFEHGVAGGIVGGVAGGSIHTAPPPPPPAPVRVGGDLSAPRLVHRVAPEYPDVAVNAQVEGMVILEATVSRSGVVEAAKVLRSHPLLDAAAVDAVRQWRYEPLLLNGKPTPFVLTVTVSFSLEATR